MGNMWLCEYDKMYGAYLDGIITTKEWKTFCFLCLEELNKMEREVLTALRNA